MDVESSSKSRSYSLLLIRAKEGSRSALNRLMEWCRPLVRARADRALRQKRGGNVDASDIVQDVFVVATRKFTQFKGENSRTFLGWLYGIVDKRILQVLRPRGESPGNPGLAGLFPPALAPQHRPPDKATSVSERLLHEEECEQLARALSWCREEDVEVISMRFSEGRSYDEIAARLDISDQAARQRCCRAIHRVGDALKLLALMSSHQINILHQDIIGLYRFQGADARQIADRLGLREEIVAQVVAGAGPFLNKPKEQKP
jgi:RNA polymerase sigma-70 factor, ECF subfamily